MGTTLTGTTPQDTYDSLIKVTDNGPLSGTAKYLSDGLGNDSTLALSTSAVGIGTNTPDSNLVVNGSGSVRVNLRASNVRYGTAYADNGIFALSSITAIPLVLATDDTERVRITSAGNVGIGTSTPTTLGAGITSLDVAGSAGGGLTTRGTTVTGELIAIDAAAGFYISTKTNHSIILRTNDVERVRITNDGLTFNGDTAAANALDDYEEGTFTPAVAFGGGTTGITYSIQSGTYTKIGRQVTINALLVLSNKGSSSGNVTLTGLPAVIGNTIGNYSAVSLRFENIGFTGQFQAYGQVGNATIDFRQISEAGSDSALTDLNFGNNSAMMLSFTYFV